MIAETKAALLTEAWMKQAICYNCGRFEEGRKNTCALTGNRVESALTGCRYHEKITVQEIKARTEKAKQTAKKREGAKDKAEERRVSYSPPASSYLPRRNYY